MQNFSQLGVLAAALDEVGEIVADLVAQESLHAGEVDELGNAAHAERSAQQVADRRAVRIAAGQGREVLEAELTGGLFDRAEDDVGGVESLAAAGVGAAGEEHRLEGNAAAGGVCEAGEDGVPQVRQVFRHHRHRQRERDFLALATVHRGAFHLAEIAAAQLVLAGFLRAVELQVQLEIPPPRAFSQLFEKAVLLRDPHAVGVHQAVVDSRLGVDPIDQLEKLRVQRRLAAGELEQLDLALPLDHAADAALQRFQRVRFQAITRRADRGIRETRRAGEIARIDDFDQREAGGEHLDFRDGRPGVAAERTGDSGRVRGARAAGAASVRRIALG